MDPGDSGKHGSLHCRKNVAHSSSQAGAITLNAFVFMSESYHPIILARKTKRLIKETGNTNLRSRLASDKTPRETFAISIVRPCKMLLFSPIVLLLSVYTAVVYGYLYLLFTTISGVFMEQYGFSQGKHRFLNIPITTH